MQKDLRNKDAMSINYLQYINNLSLLSFNPHHQFQSVLPPKCLYNLDSWLYIFRTASLVQYTKNSFCFCNCHLSDYISSGHSLNSSPWCNTSYLSKSQIWSCDSSFPYQWYYALRIIILLEKCIPIRLSLLPLALYASAMLASSPSLPTLLPSLGMFSYLSILLLLLFSNYLA